MKQTILLKRMLAATLTFIMLFSACPAALAAEVTASPLPEQAAMIEEQAAPAAAAKVEDSSGALASPTPTVSPSASPSASPTPSASPSASPTPTLTPSPSPSLSPSPTPTATLDLMDKVLQGDPNFKATVTSPSSKLAQRGDTITVKIRLAETLGNCGGVTMNLQFDSAQLALNDAYASFPSGGTVVINPTYAVNKVRVVYVNKASSPAQLSGTLLTATFTVKSSAAYSAAAFKVEVPEVCDLAGNKIVGKGDTDSITVQPAAPTLNGALSSSSLAIALSWNRIPSVSGYSVWRGTSISTLASYTTLPSNVSTYTDTNLAFGQRYYYRVWAFYTPSSGSKVYCPTPAAFTAATPADLVLSQPVVTVATKNAAKIQLTWPAVSGAAGYSIYRGTDPNVVPSTFVSGASAGAGSFTDTDLVPAQRYYYVVKAYATHYGKGRYATSAKTTAVAELNAPVARISSASGSGISVAWTAVPGASGYSIYRGPSASSLTKITDVTSGTSYTDSAVTLGTRYYYKVWSYRNYTTQNQGSGTVRCTTVPAAVTATAGTAPTLKQPTLSLSAPYVGRVALSWDAITNADGYYILRGTTTDNIARYQTVTGRTTTSFTDTNVYCGQRYYYRVQAYCDVQGQHFESLWSARSTILGPDIAIPTARIASASADEIQLAWNAVQGATGYSIYRGTSTSNLTFLKRVESGSATSYADTSGLILGTRYYYRVFSYYNNPSGVRKFCGAPAAVTATAGTAPTLKQPTLSLSAPYVGRVALSWDAIANADGYYILRGTTTDNIARYQTVTGRTTTSFTDTNVYCDQRYYYRVQAYCDVQGQHFESLWSARSTILGPDIAIPTARVTSASADEIQLAWNAVQGATGYSIYRGTSTSNLTFLKRVESGNASSCADTSNLVSGTRYYYRVFSYYNNPSGVRKFCSTPAAVTVVVPDPVLAAPVVAIDYANSGGIKLSWPRVAYAEGYSIYRGTSSSSLSYLTALGDVTSPTITDSRVTPNTTYYYQVRAYYTNSAAKLVYARSAVKTATASLTRPSFSLSTQGDAIKLTWTAVPGATGYSIYRGTTSSTTHYKSVTNGSTLYLDEGVVSGQTYYYAVWSYYLTASGSKVFCPAALTKSIQAP